MKSASKKMDVRMERVYQALLERKLIAGKHPQKELAVLLNVLSQHVNNWEKRGPSQDAMLQLQQQLHLNVNYVRTGELPKFIQGGNSAEAGQAHLSTANVSTPYSVRESTRHIAAELSAMPRSVSAGTPR